MRIMTVTARWGRADFSAIFVCENCLAQTKIKYCYDDDFYHRHVIPSFACPDCGESRNSIDSINHTCPHCGVAPGTACMTPKGAKAHKPHLKRIHAARRSNRIVEGSGDDQG